MTLAAAPIFNTPVRTPVESAYHAWATHYNSCPTCQRGEWYEPYVPWLCFEGAMLLATWERTAVAKGPTGHHRG